MSDKSRGRLATRPAAILLAAALSLAACAPARAPAATPSPTPPPPGYAGNPVTSNSQWTPLTQTFDGVDMLLVPAGCFMMGSTDAQIKTTADTLLQPLDWIRGEAKSEQPATKVCFDRPFWIDRVEVTNAEFTRLGGQAEIDNRWVGDYRPRASITRSEASGFCQKRGARLPTEAAWEYAARGPDALPWPPGHPMERCWQ